MLLQKVSRRQPDVFAFEDYCPQVLLTPASDLMNSIWKRRPDAETKLTIEGWVYLVFLAFITIGSILRNVNLLVLMAGLLYAPLILQWRVCNKLMRNLRAIRAIPQRLHAGESVKMTWTVHNDSQEVTAWNVLVSDQIVRDRLPDALSENKTLAERVRSSWALENEAIGQQLKRLVIRLWEQFSDFDRWRGDDGALMSIDRVDGGQSRTGAWEVSFPKRGRYDIGPARLSSTSTLGLQVCRLRLNAVQHCYVAPGLGTLNRGWFKRLQSISPGDGTGMRRRGMDQEEFHALRNWRSGDSKKHIHWRTTARYGLPIVRQFDQNNDQDIAIVLDLYCPSAEEGYDEQQVVKFRRDAELALSFAATVLSRAKVDIRGRITLGVCGQDKHFIPGRRPDFLASAMKALAVAQSGPRPPVVEALLDSVNVISAGTSIQVISTRPEPDLVVLASSGQQADDRVREVSHAIVARRLQNIKSAVDWVSVDSPAFQQLFSTESPSETGPRVNRSRESTSTSVSDPRLVS